MKTLLLILSMLLFNTNSYSYYKGQDYYEETFGSSGGFGGIFEIILIIAGVILIFYSFMGFVGTKLTKKR